jgi:hypothetical protein
MTGLPLGQRARAGRTSGAALKLQLSNLRSREATKPIFVFEGPTDVGPYETWIHRIIDPPPAYLSLPGAGKDQLLALRQLLVVDLTGLRAHVYFFVDRDFDDLKGQTAGPDIYCTDTYSIENVLASDAVASSILNDEFRCAGAPADHSAAITAYQAVKTQFLQEIRDVNLRIFRSRRLSIPGREIPIAGRFLAIALTSVTRTYTPGTLQTLIPLDREPTAAECAKVDPDFAALDSENRFRGKFFVHFLMVWLDLLAADRRGPTPAIFSTAANIRFSSQQLTLRSLASRSALPTGLSAFVRTALS